jgi:hypothetical protein
MPQGSNPWPQTRSRLRYLLERGRQFAECRLQLAGLRASESATRNDTHRRPAWSAVEAQGHAHDDSPPLRESSPPGCFVVGQVQDQSRACIIIALCLRRVGLPLSGSSFRCFDPSQQHPDLCCLLILSPFVRNRTCRSAIVASSYYRSSSIIRTLDIAQYHPPLPGHPSAGLSICKYRARMRR